MGSRKRGLASPSKAAESENGSDSAGQTQQGAAEANVESNPSASAHTREAAAEWVPIGDLKPWSRNPRKNDKAIAKVADSIKRFGFGNPILARRADGEIIAGHTRIAAAEKLGLERVPVRFLDLDPADAHLLALADNKLGEIAEWDAAELASILNEYSREDADLAGWDEQELSKLAGTIIEEAEADESAYAEQYGVIVVCSDARDQERAYEHLTGLGYNCKVVVT